MRPLNVMIREMSDRKEGVNRPIFLGKLQK